VNLCGVFSSGAGVSRERRRRGDAGEYDGGDEEREDSAAARELLRLTCNGLERMGDGAEEDDVKDDAAKLEDIADGGCGRRSCSGTDVALDMRPAKNGRGTRR